MRLTKKISIIIAIIVFLIIILYALLPLSTNEEYKYTIQILFKYAFPFLIVLWLILPNPLWRSSLLRDASSKYVWLGLAAALFILIPLLTPVILPFAIPESLLSLCWIIGCLCLAIFIFITAARLNNWLSGLLCLFASLILAFACAEIWFLATWQFPEGIAEDSAHSKYVQAGQAQPQFQSRKTARGRVTEKPNHPSGAVAHRKLFKERELFDVKYTFDARGRRIMPPRPDTPPAAELMIFGCSYTFGYGLENDQTWAWLLATDLGSEWKVINYAENGYGAQQMLDMLLDKSIDLPTAPFRQALFLALQDHLFRFTGLCDYCDSSRYTIKDGKLARLGLTFDDPLHILPTLPKIMAGSQAVREISAWIGGAIRRARNQEWSAIYLKLIVDAAKILKDEYNAPLTVLVWPEMSWLVSELHKRQIPTLLAETFLPGLAGDTGAQYYIDSRLDIHPNAKAALELANGLGKYYLDMWIKSRQ